VDVHRRVGDDVYLCRAHPTLNQIVRKLLRHGDRVDPAIHPTLQPLVESTAASTPNEAVHSRYTTTRDSRQEDSRKHVWQIAMRVDHIRREPSEVLPEKT